MTNKEKQYLQKLEGESWVRLAQAHSTFMRIHGTFSSFEEYDKAISEYKPHRSCLNEWYAFRKILEHFKIPYNDELHHKAYLISSNEPKHFNY